MSDDDDQLKTMKATADALGLNKTEDSTGEFCRPAVPSSEEPNPNVNERTEHMDENNTASASTEMQGGYSPDSLRSVAITLAGAEGLVGTLARYTADQKQAIANLREGLVTIGFGAGIPHAGIAAELNAALKGADQLVLGIHKTVERIRADMVAPAIEAAELARQRMAR